MRQQSKAFQVRNLLVALARACKIVARGNMCRAQLPRASLQDIIPGVAQVLAGDLCALSPIPAVYPHLHPPVEKEPVQPPSLVATRNLSA